MIDVLQSFSLIALGVALILQGRAQQRTTEALRCLIEAMATLTDLHERDRR